MRFDEGLSYELPYPDKTFDRVLSASTRSNVLLSREDKLRTAREVFRVLRPGGELHVADWGKAATPLMRDLFYAIQILDGFPNTADSVLGRLPEVFRSAGFRDVAVNRRFLDGLRDHDALSGNPVRIGVDQGQKAARRPL